MTAAYAAAFAVAALSTVVVCLLVEAVLHPYRSTPTWSTVDWLGLAGAAAFLLLIVGCWAAAA